MSIINRLVISNFKKNKKRTRATFISILLSCVLLFCVTIGISTFKHENIKDAMEYNGSYHAKFSNIDYSTKEVFTKDKKVFKVDILQEIDTLKVSPLSFNNDVNLTIYSFEKDYNEYINLAYGRMPENYNEIIISNEFSLLGNYQVGDEILSYKIVGIYSKSKFYTTEYVNTSSSHEFSPIGYTKKKIDENSQKSVFFVTYKSVRNAYSKIVNDKNAMNSNVKVEANTSLLTSYGVYEDTSRHLKTYMLLLVVLYIVSMFCILIVYNSFSISTIEREKEYGILRCIGAEKKQIKSLVFMEAVILGIVCIPLALILGFGLIESIIIIINKTLKTSITIHLYLSYLFIAILFIAFTILISVITPAKKASDTSPLGAIKGNKDYSIKKSKEHYPFIRKIFGVEGEIAVKNVKRNKSKFTAVIISLTVCIVLFISLTSFINYIMDSAIGDYKENYDIHIFIEDLKEAEKVSFVDKIKNIRYIDDIVLEKNSFLYFIADKYEDDDYKNMNHLSLSNSTSHNLNFVGLDKESYKKYKQNLGIKDDGYILYNTYTFTDLTGKKFTGKALREGVKLDIVRNDKSDESYLSFDNLHLTNENYLNTFYGVTLVVDIDTYDELVDKYISKYPDNFQSVDTDYKTYLMNKMSININSHKFKKFDSEFTELLDANTNLNISYNNYTLEEYEQYMSYMTIKAIFYGIIGFVALISMSGILNAISINLKLREREFSMFRSVGLSKKRLAKVLSLESIFIVSKTLIIGIPVSIMIILLFKAITGIDNQDSLIANEKVAVMSIPWIYIALTIVVVIFVVVMATMRCSKSLRNQNIIDSIRKDSI